MGLKVLMVDDDKMAVFLQRIIMAECDFTQDLISFSNGRDTLQFLDQDHFCGDDYFIFLDINMPVMSGWELLDTLKTRSYSGNIFVSLAAAYPTNKELERITQYKQIIHLFEKPVTEEMCETIKQLPALNKFFCKATANYTHTGETK